jgi:5-methylcytosine-specific restriction endonuclease McrA
MRKWYSENRDEQLAKQKDYADGRREEIRAYKRRYAKDHSKRLAEKTAAWREENPGRIQTWREANPDHSRRNHAARKARHNALPYERVDLDAVRERSDGLCWLCKGELGDDATADHLIPLAAHPDDVAVWGVERPGHVTANLDMAHRGCNTSKHKRLMLCAIARYLRYAEQDAVGQGPCRSEST